ncbi:hypothetical protein [Streptomyces sp. UNOC14_S4]|uniref:hypothetical protein n=1 Tax=Streptomyces sp. UNOC14_S4 TaxID=2872340 RepID=UPI001E2F54C5|nr:hypothetical protein [Streptomyces sp. UNOC14_S4]MCC3766356.1 hypothetical protein [Streptomyces sp. UNOC14_S4]
MFRRTAVVAAVCAIAATTAGSAPVRAVGVALTCGARTDPGQPVTLTPPLSMRQRTVTASGTFHLTDCFSPDRTQTRLRSGRLSFHGTGQANCTSTSGVRGSATITWYDGAGRKVGTSTLRPGTRQVNSYNPADALLSGTVVHGALAGARVTGSAVPTSDVTQCSTTGLRAVNGWGKVTFVR